VHAWLDAPRTDEAILRRLVDELNQRNRKRPAATVRRSTSPPSRQPAVSFTGALTDRIQQLLPEAPLLPTVPDTIAGVLAAAGGAFRPQCSSYAIRTGVSHAPSEHAAAADCTDVSRRSRPCCRIRMPMTRYHADLALVDGHVATDVLIEVTGSRFVR